MVHSSQHPTHIRLTQNKHILLPSLSMLVVLKEEPDDTAHYTLSPTSSATSGSCSSNSSFIATATDNNGALNVEQCLPPLDDSTPLFGEIFDELILPDGYGTLLADDITTSIDAQSNKINIDPFINYRDESCDTVGTPMMLSPETLSKVNSNSHNFSVRGLIVPLSPSFDTESGW